MNTIKTVQRLAAQVRNGFVRKKRKNGADYWLYKGVTPIWIQEMCGEAHSDMMPDDHKYQFIVEALDAIAENEDEARSYLGADIYTSDLLAWLSSNVTRIEYVNQAGNDFGVGVNFNLVELMQLGQVIEKIEVFDSILYSLQEQLKNMDSKAS